MAFLKLKQHHHIVTKRSQTSTEQFKNFINKRYFWRFLWSWLISFQTTQALYCVYIKKGWDLEEEERSLVPTHVVSAKTAELVAVICETGKMYKVKVIKTNTLTSV